MKKKSKIKPIKKSNMKKLSIILVIILLVVAFGGIIYYSNLVLIKNKVVLESGTSIKNLEDYFIKKQGNLEIKRIEYKNTNKKVKARERLVTIDVYLDSKGNIVDRDKACTKKGTKEKPKYALKKGYTKDTRLIDVYSYDVKIIAKDGRVFKSKLVLKDTLSPKLIAKESVEVTEGDEIKADMFFERYEDASNRAHGDIYFVKEVKVDAKDIKKAETKTKEKSSKQTLKETKTSFGKKTTKNTTKKTTNTKKSIIKYEKYELTDEDKKVGEHELLIVVEDQSKNVSDPVKVKLIVKEKSLEFTSEEVQASGGAYSGNRSYSGGRGYASNSGGTCGSQGFTTGFETVTIDQMYIYWGCDGVRQYDAYYAQASNAMKNEAWGLNACNDKYGYLTKDPNDPWHWQPCMNFMKLPEVFDKATGQSVGIYAPYTMYITINSNDPWDWQTVGEGILKPWGVQWYWKNF